MLMIMMKVLERVEKYQIIVPINIYTILYYKLKLSRYCTVLWKTRGD